MIVLTEYVAVGKETVGKAVASSTKSPSEVGFWQEIIIWNIIIDTATQRFGQGELNTSQKGHVKQTIIWKNGSKLYTVNWYTPNTHPYKTGTISKPEFDICVNGTRRLNLESKNWKLDYKPLSLATTKSQIISRFQHIIADQNVVVISEWRTENGNTAQIEKLLNQWNVKVVLTHRQTTGVEDQETQNIIKTKLNPILDAVFQ